jgi:hypothetical protein
LRLIHLETGPKFRFSGLFPYSKFEASSLGIV